MSGVVTLEPWEVEWAHAVGLRRHYANAAKGDAAYYDPSLMEDNIRASRAAACAEMAVAKFLNRFWSGSVWDSALHDRYKGIIDDVSGGYEVRRTRKRDGSLVVRSKDVDKKSKIVLTYPAPPNFEEVRIIGWLPADIAWDLGTPAPYDKAGTTRLVDQENLWPLTKIASPL